MSKRRSRGRNHEKIKKVNFIYVISILIVLLILFFLTFLSLLNMGNSKILHNIYINGISVSSLSQNDAKEKLNLMLASNDYPDLILIDRSSGMIDKFISAKALIPLEDLIEEYAPNIKEQYGEYLNRSVKTVIFMDFQTGTA